MPCPLRLPPNKTPRDKSFHYREAASILITRLTDDTGITAMILPTQMRRMLNTMHTKTLAAAIRSSQEFSPWFFHAPAAKFALDKSIQYLKTPQTRQTNAAFQTHERFFLYSHFPKITLSSSNPLSTDSQFTQFCPIDQECFN